MISYLASLERLLLRNFQIYDFFSRFARTIIADTIFKFMISFLASLERLLLRNFQIYDL